jgi:hypothetical protein
VLHTRSYFAILSYACCDTTHTVCSSGASKTQEQCSEVKSHLQMEMALRLATFPKAYAAGTFKSYESQIRIYLRFATDFPTEWRWSDCLGGLWLRHCIDSGAFKKNTLQGKISAFKHGVLKYTGRIVGHEKGSVFHLLSRELTRMSDDVERKRPVVLAELKRVWQYVRQQPASAELWENVLRWLVSYSCMLRSAEAARLTWKGIEFQFDAENRPESLQLSLLVSNGEVFKTHSNAVRFNLKARPAEGDFCVVRMMWIWQCYVLKEKGKLEGVVFTSSVDRCRNIFKEICHKVLKCEERGIGLHSVRNYVYGKMEISHGVGVSAKWSESSASIEFAMEAGNHGETIDVFILNYQAVVAYGV